jgi:hypothetical protein
LKEFISKYEKLLLNFSFINSWDDLATYNIAKKWLEYLSNFQNNAKI